MSSVKITSPAELRDVAKQFGVALPSRGGRLPSSKLRVALRSAGVEIVSTEYFPSEDTRAPAAYAGEAIFVATVRVEITEKTWNEGVSAKGKPFKVPGKPRTVTRDREVSMTAAEIRKLTGTFGQRGRVSRESLSKAFTAHFDGAIIIDGPRRASATPAPSIDPVEAVPLPV